MPARRRARRSGRRQTHLTVIALVLAVAVLSLLAIGFTVLNTPRAPSGKFPRTSIVPVTGKALTPTCTDTTPGTFFSFAGAGTVTANGNTYADTCLTSSVMEDVSCGPNGEPVADYVDCRGVYAETIKGQAVGGQCKNNLCVHIKAPPKRPQTNMLDTIPPEWKEDGGLFFTVPQTKQSTTLPCNSVYGLYNITPKSVDYNGGDIVTMDFDTMAPLSQFGYQDGSVTVELYGLGEFTRVNALNARVVGDTVTFTTPYLPSQHRGALNIRITQPWSGAFPLNFMFDDQFSTKPGFAFQAVGWNYNSKTPNVPAGTPYIISLFGYGGERSFAFAGKPIPPTTIPGHAGQLCVNTSARIFPLYNKSVAYFAPQPTGCPNLQISGTVPDDPDVTGLTMSMQSDSTITVHGGTREFSNCVTPTVI